MMNYYIKQLDDNQYYIICLDFNSILNYLDEIEKEESIRNNEGCLIVDQLLVAGNGKNRFLSCKFSFGKIMLETAQNIAGTEILRKISSCILKTHFESLKYSILTDNQKEKIYHGQIV